MSHQYKQASGDSAKACSQLTGMTALKRNSNEHGSNCGSGFSCPAHDELAVYRTGERKVLEAVFTDCVMERD